jgi:hypothetical protein
MIVPYKTIKGKAFQVEENVIPIQSISYFLVN